MTPALCVEGRIRCETLCTKSAGPDEGAFCWVRPVLDNDDMNRAGSMEPDRGSPLFMVSGENQADLPFGDG